MNCAAAAILVLTLIGGVGLDDALPRTIHGVTVGESYDIRGEGFEFFDESVSNLRTWKKNLDNGILFVTAGRDNVVVMVVWGMDASRINLDRIIEPLKAKYASFVKTRSYESTEFSDSRTLMTIDRRDDNMLISLMDLRSVALLSRNTQEQSRDPFTDDVGAPADVELPMFGERSRSTTPAPAEFAGSLPREKFGVRLDAPYSSWSTGFIKVRIAETDFFIKQVEQVTVGATVDDRGSCVAIFWQVTATEAQKREYRENLRRKYGRYKVDIDLGQQADFFTDNQTIIGAIDNGQVLLFTILSPDAVGVLQKFSNAMEESTTGSILP